MGSRRVSSCWKKFGLFDGAVEWWGSQEYAAAKALRQSLSKTDIVIVDGYDGAHG